MNAQNDHEIRTEMLSVFREVLSGMPDEIVGKPEIEGSSLLLLGKRMRLRPVFLPNEPGVHPSIVHVHVVTELQSKLGPIPLESCVVGIDQDRLVGIKQAAIAWRDFAAPPIFSILHGRPVLDAVHFDGSEVWAVPNRHGFAGPFNVRILTQPGVSKTPPFDVESLLDLPLLTHVDELVFDTVPHLAKVTLNSDGNGCWKRSLDFDNHELGFSEIGWKPPITLPDVPIIATRFVTFFNVANSSSEPSRPKIATLDEAIRQFVTAFEGIALQDFVLKKGIDHLCSFGVDPNVADRLSQFIVLAFGRMLAQPLGAQHSETYVYVDVDGRYDIDRRIEAEPMFFRAAALMPDLMQTERLKEIVLRVAIEERDLQILTELLERKGNPKNMLFSPPFIFAHGIDREIAQQTADEVTSAFIAESEKYVKRKKWWQFWK